MPLALTAAPRSAFVHHAKQLQTVRRAISSATPFAQGFFKPAASVIKPWRALAGAREWQTGVYHYNKQTQKTLPTAAATTDKLLRDYVTMIESRGPSRSSASSSTARTAIAARRKVVEKVYISGTSAKDYGDKIVINAYLFNGIEAAAAEQREKVAKSAPRAPAGEKQDGRARPVRSAAGVRRPGGPSGRPRGPAAERTTGPGR